MTEQEKIEFEREIRHKILMEQRERKAQWRASHKESIKRSNDKYRSSEKYDAQKEKRRHYAREYYKKKKAERETNRLAQEVEVVDV
jgi:hypothetical protein